MLFNSIEFVIFLPIVFLLYWFLFSKSSKSQNTFLLLASYVFYAFANYRFIILLTFTTVCTYYSALAINKYKEQGDIKKAKMMSTLNIVANLLVLGFFKYYNFFVSSFAALLPGVNADNLMLNIVLPLGISYYTFTALSYSIDVYWGKTKATKDFIQVATYISFFPQILAGPIGRSTYLLEQYNNKRVFNYEESVDGLRQILWGLFKKIVVADYCAIYVNNIWDSFAFHSSLELIITLFIFAVQLYGDFSGYSDIAIGISKLFGIKLNQNFRFPLFSTNIADFWSRWHISLTSWFRDYVYTPLGGVWTKVSIIRNIFIVFTLCGLWHGASLNFVIWGLYNALLFTPYVLCFNYRKEKKLSNVESIIFKLKKLIVTIFTDILILGGLILFRAESLKQSVSYFLSICRLDPIDSSIVCLYQNNAHKRIIIIIIMIAIEWIIRKKDFSLYVSNIHSRIIRWSIYYFLTFLIIVLWGTSQLFVYFQF